MLVIALAVFAVLPISYAVTSEGLKTPWRRGLFGRKPGNKPSVRSSGTP
jgi:hypothetical protein